MNKLVTLTVAVIFREREGSETTKYSELSSLYFSLIVKIHDYKFFPGAFLFPSSTERLF